MHVLCSKVRYTVSLLGSVHYWKFQCNRTNQPIMYILYLLCISYCILKLDYNYFTYTRYLLFILYIL